MINEKIHRWAFASFAKHVKDAAELANLPMVVELLDTRSDAWKESRHRGETHLVGPHVNEESKNWFRVEMGIFVTVSSHLHTNAYTHLNKVGEVAKALSQCVLVKTYGEDVESELVRMTQQDEVRVTHIKPTLPDAINHSVIEAKYLGFYLGE